MKVKLKMAPAAAQNLPQRAVYINDNLPVLRGFNSETTDLVYLDPPFNTGRGFPLPGGGAKKKMAFADTWKWSDEHEQHRYMLGLDSPDAAMLVDTVRRINGHSHGAYLVYMGVRLLEIRRILKPSGSVYFHCDPTMSHGVKLLMDAVFGKNNFRNEIVWWYSWGVHTKKHWNKKHDIILNYAKSGKDVFFDGDKARVPYREGSIMTTDPKWNKKYHPDGKLPEDVFDIPTINAMAKERTGYPTQKPMALMERIIAASCKPGALVLDPFCGCATTCVAAEKLRRKWIGIDVSPEAKHWVEERLYRTGIGAFASRHNKPIAYPKKPPQRTDLPHARINRKEWLPVLYARQKGVCNGCRRDVEADYMDIDHIIPKARGGGDMPANLQLLCRACNTIKGAGTMTELFDKLARLESEKNMRQWREGINQRIVDARKT